MRRRPARWLLAAAAVLVCCSACGDGRTVRPAASTTARGHASSAAARPAGHVVVVVMENRSYGDVIGRRAAPYLNSLAGSGTSFAAMHAVRHPSQPNYVALFSGSTHGVTTDACPQRLRGPNLATQLRANGRTFAGYAEGLPRPGSAVCSAGSYVRRHAPWTHFANVPAAAGRPLTAFPRDYSRLPTVAWVIPDLDHDMHDGTVAQGDRWLRGRLGGYATWARTHDSVLVVTWDEDDRTTANHIPTVMVGAGVPHRVVTRRVTTFSVLRAIEDRYGLPRLGAAASAPSLGGW